MKIEIKLLQAKYKFLFERNIVLRDNYVTIDNVLFEHYDGKVKAFEIILADIKDILDINEVDKDE